MSRTKAKIQSSKDHSCVKNNLLTSVKGAQNLDAIFSELAGVRKRRIASLRGQLCFHSMAADCVSHSSPTAQLRAVFAIYRLQKMDWISRLKRQLLQEISFGAIADTSVQLAGRVK